MNGKTSDADSGDIIKLAATVLGMATASFLFMMLNESDITFKEFPFDDAWIHLVYVRGWLRDGLPTYNPTIKESGFSSPLWLIAAMPAYLLSTCALPLVLLVKMTGALFGAVAAFGAALLTHRLTRRLTASISTVALIYLWPAFGFSAVSGMEVTLTAACLVWAVHLFSSRKYAGSGLLIALACLARPESAAALLAMLAILAMRHSSRALRPGLYLLLPSVVLGATWLGYNTLAFGHPLPNTFYVKADLDLLRNLRYVLPQVWLGDTPAFPILATLLLGAGLVRLRPRSTLSPELKRALIEILAVAVAGLLAVFLSRPVFKYITFFQQRYYTPYAFLLFPLLGVFLDTEDILPLSRVVRRIVMASFMAAGAISMLQARAVYWEHCQEIHTLHTQPALLIREKTEPDAVIAVEGAGAMRYHSDRFTIDILGLNHHEIAHADNARFLCILKRENPTIVAVPTAFNRNLSQFFHLRPLAVFSVEHSHFTAHRGPRTLSIFAASLRSTVGAHCDGARHQ